MLKIKGFSLLLGVSIMISSLIPSFNALAATGGAYETGVYRNLFVETGKTQAQVDAKLEAAWNQIFYGNDSTQRLFYPVGTDMAYIKDVNNNDVRSEGMSYGMMICVQMDKQAEFDKLWKWAKTYMYQNNGQFKGFFAWQCNTNGGIIDSTPASDGDEYFAMSLLFASNRWGDDTGVNYKAEAKPILDAMLHQSEDGVGVNMFDRNQKQVVFCPIGDSAQFTDPSYHLPAFYELWALWDDSDNALWSEIAATSRRFFPKTINSTTGLGPDYANFDGSAKDVSWSSGHADFRYDAWRTTANIVVDYAWFGKDSWATTFADKIQNFFYSKGLTSYGSNYTLTGTQLNTDHSPGLVAMNAVASLATTSSKSKEFVNELWNTSIPSGTYRYYDGMLYMLGMLHCSGNFKIWKPGGSSKLLGDLNSDGNIDAIDFAQMKVYLLGPVGGKDLQVWDMNSDGQIDVLDLVELKKILLNQSI